MGMRYLEHRGYTVLETAWKCPAGTCDVIAEDGDAIVFVDVSARRDTDKGLPSERCSAGVRKRHEMVAPAWFAEHEEAVDMAVRFDNIAMLVMGDSRAIIRHRLNACFAKSAPVLAFNGSTAASSFWAPGMWRTKRRRSNRSAPCLPGNHTSRGTPCNRARRRRWS